MPHRHNVHHADNVRTPKGVMHQAAVSGLGDCDCDGAVPLSRESEDGNDLFVLPDCLSPCVLRHDNFDRQGILYCKIMAWRAGKKTPTVEE